MSADDGNTAFPVTEAHGANSGWCGMSLRDYFAAKVLAALITMPMGRAKWDGMTTDAGIAEVAYQMADAMLAARKVQP